MLCKKVAQLTKVIYHLNTKNEDQETRLALMQQTYEAEIERVVQEAAEKLSESSGTIEELRRESGEQLTKRVADLAAKYEHEKKAAHAQWHAEMGALRESADSRMARRSTCVDMQGTQMRTRGLGRM